VRPIVIKTVKALLSLSSSVLETSHAQVFYLRDVKTPILTQLANIDASIAREFSEAIDRGEVEVLWNEIVKIKNGTELAQYYW
jgi:hypothetical protein